MFRLAEQNRVSIAAAGERWARSLTRALILLAALTASGPARLVGQACPNGQISFIFINSHPVFDTTSLTNGKSLEWLYNFANWLHMETDEEFIQGELLFKVGDCYDPFLVAESERIIRQLGFIARVDVFAVPQFDGSVHIVVDTQDEWTLQVTVRARFDEGFEFNGLDVTEENVLGKGVAARAFYRERREARAIGGAVQTARFLGTRWDAQLQAGETRVGPFFQQAFVYPFVGEVGRYAATQFYTRREDLFAYALPEGGVYTHVVTPFLRKRAELTVAGRLGEAGRLTILGLGISRDDLDFGRFEEGPEAVRNRDFANTEPAPPELSAPVAPQTRGRSATRLNFLLGQRNLRFERRAGLDALRGVQDVPVGGEVSLTLGRSFGFLGPDSETEDDDFFGRIRVFGGLAPGRWVLAGSVGFEARRIFDGPQEGWRDAIGEFDVYTYWQPLALPRHTLFARISGAAGWSMTVPFQLTLGGPFNLRGHGLDHAPGGRRLMGSFEDRIYLGSPAGGLFDLGLTAFLDVGSVWRGDTPFGGDSGFGASAGAGLRLGFPGGTRRVIRIDLAFPVNGPDAFKEPVFRITATELLGLLQGFADPQLRRSRR